MRRVCVVVHSRANYGRIKSVLRAISYRQDLELQLIVGASAVLYRYGDLTEKIQEDGFSIDAIVHSMVEGDTPATMAKSTGLTIIELSSHFDRLKPDVVVTVADRYETLATAIAASYMNIPLAHTQGGEVTGSIDESVRHAVTKLAHVHFPATERAEQFLLKMGEQRHSVLLSGCPSIDLVKNIKLTLPADFFHRMGSGGLIDEKQPYLIIMQHPVTTEYDLAGDQIIQTKKAAEQLLEDGMQILWLWPNIDAGADQISKQLREFGNRRGFSKLQFVRNFSPEDYACVLNNSSCIVGNSSSGLREGSFLGVPCVNIGSRQRNREQAGNVINVLPAKQQILDAVRVQLNNGKYPKSILFGDGTAGERIAAHLASCALDVNKTLSYL